MKRLNSVALCLTHVLLLPLLLAGGGCERQEEEIARLLAEARAWQTKYESLTTQSAALQGRVTLLKVENQDLQAQMTALSGAAGLDDELAQQKRRVRELEGELARLQQRRTPPAEGERSSEAEALRERLDQARERLEGLGAALFERSEYDIALAVLRIAQQLGSDSPQTCYQVAYCEAALGDYEAAGKHYERALAALEPQPEKDEELLKKCLSNCGVAMLQLGDLEKAEQLYRKAIALDDTYAPAYYNLGLLYANEPSKPDEAIEALRKHIIYGGRRGISARNLIGKLQAAEGQEERQPGE